MKRDLELIKELLTYIENSDGRRNLSALNIHIDGVDPQQINYSLSLMKEAGLITYEGKKLKKVTRFVHCTRLTFKGHEMLDAMRKDTFWHKLIEHAKDKSIDSAIAIALDLIKKSIGL